jgi:hypothetical protein
MVSPRSVELKKGAKEPSMEEAKRCELKIPAEIKRTAGIRCGGRVMRTSPLTVLLHKWMNTTHQLI